LFPTGAGDALCLVPPASERFAQLPFFPGLFQEVIGVAETGVEEWSASNGKDQQQSDL
jgi:hypothetical protein